MYLMILAYSVARLFSADTAAIMARLSYVIHTHHWFVALQGDVMLGSTLATALSRDSTWIFRLPPRSQCSLFFFCGFRKEYWVKVLKIHYFWKGRAPCTSIRMEALPDR
jgi:hypothetical protein